MLDIIDMVNINDIHNIHYTELEALKALYENMDMAANEIIAINNEHTDDMLYGQITIIVNGIAHAFILGGPQMTALSLFIEHIALENGHDLTPVYTGLCPEQCINYDKCQRLPSVKEALENYLHCNRPDQNKNK